MWPSYMTKYLTLINPKGQPNYMPSAPLLYEVASHVKQLPFRPLLLLLLLLLSRSASGVVRIQFLRWGFSPRVWREWRVVPSSDQHVYARGHYVYEKKDMSQ